MHNKLEITACRLFKIDFSLLHSVSNWECLITINVYRIFLLQIGAAVTIYLMIMLQFDIELHKAAPQNQSTFSDDNITKNMNMLDF